VEGKGFHAPAGSIYASLMRLAVLLLTLLVPFGLPALAAEPVCCEIAGDQVRLRAGPGTKHAVLASLDRGALVVLTGREGRWCRVRIPGGFACFVHKSLVKRGRDGAASVDASRVLLRATAGKDLLALETVLERGDELTVLGEKGDWLRIVPPERVHLYVFEELLKELGPATEYRAAIQRSAAARRAGLLGTVEKKIDEELKRRELKEAALAAGEAVLSGGGDLEELTATLRRVSMDSDDDLTRGYANALLALLSLRRDAERLEKALAEQDRERAEEVVDLEKRLAAAEKDYKDALAKARAGSSRTGSGSRTTWGSASA